MVEVAVKKKKIEHVGALQEFSVTDVAVTNTFGLQTKVTFMLNHHEFVVTWNGTPVRSLDLFYNGKRIGLFGAKDDFIESINKLMACAVFMVTYNLGEHIEYWARNPDAVRNMATDLLSWYDDGVHPVITGFKLGNCKIIDKNRLELISRDASEFSAYLLQALLNFDDDKLDGLEIMTVEMVNDCVTKLVLQHNKRTYTLLQQQSSEATFCSTASLTISSKTDSGELCLLFAAVCGRVSDEHMNNMMALFCASVTTSLGKLIYSGIHGKTVTRMVDQSQVSNVKWLRSEIKQFLKDNK